MDGLCVRRIFISATEKNENALDKQKQQEDLSRMSGYRMPPGNMMGGGPSPQSMAQLQAVQQQLEFMSEMLGRYHFLLSFLTCHAWPHANGQRVRVLLEKVHEHLP